ncbi:MAG: carboxypeptidase-like regulatory domain-containing protein [Candidatus Sumerlaeia bacterium]|nr:carboxypeptidase-like regulatory domain-containing protein [Candidatus Sumerlaeia bacterium]
MSSLSSRSLHVFALWLAVASPFACQKGAIVKGRVVNRQTGQPVAGASVSVQFQKLDERYNWVDGGRFDRVAGAGGEFEIQHENMQARFTILARASGFYPNYECPALRQMQTTSLSKVYRVEIGLMPVVAPQPLPAGEGEIQYHMSGRRMGWNFAARRMTAESESDFVGEPDESGRQIAVLVARGNGGFYRARGLFGEYALFNMPVAPTADYVPRVDLRETAQGERAVFFIRTADGVHYAKIDIAGDVRSREYIGLRFFWVYQPNGTTALEIPLPEVK